MTSGPRKHRCRARFSRCPPVRIRHRVWRALPGGRDPGRSRRDHSGRQCMGKLVGRHHGRRRRDQGGIRRGRGAAAQGQADADRSDVHGIRPVYRRRFLRQRRHLQGGPQLVDHADDTASGGARAPRSARRPCSSCTWPIRRAFSARPRSIPASGGVPRWRRVIFPSGSQTTAPPMASRRISQGEPSAPRSSRAAARASSRRKRRCRAPEVSSGSRNFAELRGVG